MKIEVNRVSGDDGELVFIVKCSQPNQIPFDIHTLEALELCRKQIVDLGNREHILTEDANESLTDLMCQAFERSKFRMTSAIREQLDPKYQPICQEIYNWIFDAQDEKLRDWMLSFDAQRSRYYFDNDPEMTGGKAQEPEWDE